MSMSLERAICWPRPDCTGVSEDQQRALLARNWVLMLEWLALGILELGRPDP